MSDPPTGRGPSLLTVPEGDTHERKVCPDCGFIAYENPKIVVGRCAAGKSASCCAAAPSIRATAIGPARGNLELNEATPAGAAREAWEEAGAMSIEGLLAIYDIPRISQVQLIYART